MERVPRHPRFRQAAIARPLVIAAVTALALAILAAAGLAATNRVSAAPSNTQPPVVSGTPEIGKELTTTNGTWSSSTPLTFTYQWRRCDKTGGSCANISSATDNNYKAAGGRRRQHAACRRDRQEQRRQRQRDKRPDRGRPRRADIQQRLSGRQERQDRPDCEPRSARAAADRLLRRALRADQQEYEQLHAEGARRQHLRRQHQGREHLRDRSALQPVQHPGGRAHRGRRHRDPGLPPRRELPCQRPSSSS